MGVNQLTMEDEGRKGFSLKKHGQWWQITRKLSSKVEATLMADHYRKRLQQVGVNLRKHHIVDINKERLPKNITYKIFNTYYMIFKAKILSIM